MLFLTVCCGCKRPVPVPATIQLHSQNVDLWKQTLAALHNRQEQEAVTTLRQLLEDPEHCCGAAFYLCIYDEPKENYVRILHTEECTGTTPGEVRLIDQILADKKKLAEFKSALVHQQSLCRKLKRENRTLERELARLRFELRKTEEIRKETEKWRLD